MVLGYGTKTGGTMTIKSRYEGVEDEVILDYSDYPTKEAVSVIDEKNLIGDGVEKINIVRNN